MAIIRRPNSKGKIRYQVRVKGQQAETFDTFAKARTYEATARLAKRRQGSMTCAELLDRYRALWVEGDLPRQKGKRPKHGTVSARDQDFARFKSEFASTPISELDALAIEVWATKNKWAVSSISPVFSYARQRKLIEHNDFAQYVPAAGDGRKHLVPLTDDEVWDLADCASRAMPQGHAFVIWQAYSGCRPSESYALDWPLDISGDDLNLTHGVYEGVIDKPKTGPRPIFLLPQAREALESVRGIAGPVFQTVWGKRLSNQSMSLTYWSRVREEFSKCRSCNGAGCSDCGQTGKDASKPKVDIYDLRHFAAHLLYVRMDRPARIVAAQLGNSPRLIEDLYGHWRVGATEQLRDYVQSQGVPDERNTSGAHGLSETADLRGVS